MALYNRILLGMALGALLGVLAGPNGLLLSKDSIVPGGAAVLTTPDGPPVAKVPAGPLPVLAWTPTHAQVRLPEGQGYVRLQPEDPLQVRTSSLGQAAVDGTAWLGKLFLNLVKMVVVPLVFSSLVVGVAGLGDLRRLGRMGGRTLGTFLVTTALALTLGVGLANLAAPGRFVADADRVRLLASYGAEAGAAASKAAPPAPLLDQLVAMVPANPLAALVSGDMLATITFALLCGVALTMIPSEKARPVLTVLDGLQEVMVAIVHLAMALAPFGVAALLFKVAGTTGLSVLGALLAYTAVVVAGLGLHLALVYGPIFALGARIAPWRALEGLRPALVVAFSTSSSNATLPVTKDCVENRLGVSNTVSSFVLPLGATVNMDGTALYQGVAAVFIAQVYSIPLTLADQAGIVLSATLASIGAAGVPGAGMITLTLVLQNAGIPLEGLALILGVDRLLDMFRTAVNVTGDAAVCLAVARGEGEQPALKLS